VRLTPLLLAVFLVAGCAPVPEPSIAGTNHLAFEKLRQASAGSRFTVLTFFSRHCPCVRAHDARMTALYEQYHGQGVGFLAIDSEIDSSESLDRAERISRGYPFDIVHEDGASIATRLGAEYATYSVIVDPSLEIRYRGGIDSDRVHLREDAASYLADALSDLVAERNVARPEAKTFGCALRLR
jgi:hypothetical protein